MNPQECEILRRVLENSDIDLSEYGIDVKLLTERKFTFEEVEASLEDKQRVKIDLKAKLQSRKYIHACCFIGHAFSLGMNLYAM